MAYHNSILKKFDAMLPEFNFTDNDHKVQLMRILMKTSDISNEGRPVKVSEQWLDCLLTEFFNQVLDLKVKCLIKHVCDSFLI